MNRPKPKLYTANGGGMFSYYDIREINEYLAAKDVELSMKDTEILNLKRANESLRLQILAP